MQLYCSAHWTDFVIVDWLMEDRLCQWADFMAPKTLSFTVDIMCIALQLGVFESSLCLVVLAFFRCLALGCCSSEVFIFCLSVCLVEFLNWMFKFDALEKNS